jgi:hypothetical protein
MLEKINYTGAFYMQQETTLLLTVLISTLSIIISLIAINSSWMTLKNLLTI